MMARIGLVELLYNALAMGTILLLINLFGPNPGYRKIPGLREREEGGNIFSRIKPILFFIA